MQIRVIGSVIGLMSFKFVKKFLYYINKRILPQQLQVHQNILHSSFQKKFDLTVPPSADDGASFVVCHFYRHLKIY